MASHTRAAPGDIRKKDAIVLKNVPCIVAKISWCSQGKHGHARYTFQGRGVFDGKVRPQPNSAVSGHFRKFRIQLSRDVVQLSHRCACRRSWRTTSCFA